MATSYANAGGTGDRTATITVTSDATAGGAGPISNLVDGAKANNNTDAWFWDGGQSSRHIVFDFGSSASKIISEAKWYQNGPSNSGNWKWQGSNDNSSYTDLSASFLLDAGGAGDVIGDLSANTTGYRYYRMTQISGTTNGSPWLWEIEFKIDDAAPAGITGTLGATDATDVAAFIGTTANAQYINAIEEPDLAHFTGFIPMAGSFAAVEDGDVSAIFANVPAGAVLNATDGLDVAAFNLELVDVLAVTELPDLADFAGIIRRRREPVTILSQN